MGWLIETVEASLRAEYADVDPVAPGYFVARQGARALVVGVSEREEGFGPGGAQATARAMAELIAHHRPEQSYLVLASGKGITADARDQLTALGVTRQGLIEFLDRFYSTAVTRQRGTYDPVQSFARLNRHLIADRVPHRYQRISIDGLPLGIETSGDLFHDMFRALDGMASGPRLHLVMGQAGGGKTVLFKALFAALYERFNDVKAKHYGALYPRPVFFVPDYLKRAESYSFDSLVGAMFETVGAASVSPGYLDWLHGQGNVVLMFDGMDEFFARQTDLFDRLQHAMARPGSRAQVVICARDSLLATNAALLSFLGRLQQSCGPQAVDVVKLLRWGAADRRQLAGLKLDGERPLPGEAPSEDVAAFEAAITASPTLVELSSTPFFCDLLIELWKGEGSALPGDVLGVLDEAIDRFLDREVGKLRGEELSEDVRAAYLLGEVDDMIEADPLTLLIPAADRAAMDLIRERIGQDVAGNPSMIPALIESHAAIGRDGVLDLLAAAAHLHRRNPARHGLGMDEATLAALLDAQDGADATAAESERRFRAMLIFKQIALFSQRPGERSVDFTHEFLADHLAARHALNVLAREPLTPAVLAEAVGDLSLERTEIFDRALRRGLAADPTLTDRVRATISGAEPLVGGYLTTLLDGPALA